MRYVLYKMSYDGIVSYLYDDKELKLCSIAKINILKLINEFHYSVPLWRYLVIDPEHQYEALFEFNEGDDLLELIKIHLPEELI